MIRHAAEALLHLRRCGGSQPPAQHLDRDPGLRDGAGSRLEQLFAGQPVDGLVKPAGQHCRGQLVGGGVDPHVAFGESEKLEQVARRCQRLVAVAGFERLADRQHGRLVANVAGAIDGSDGEPVLPGWQVELLAPEPDPESDVDLGGKRGPVVDPQLHRADLVLRVVGGAFQRERVGQGGRGHGGLECMDPHALGHVLGQGHCHAFAGREGLWRAVAGLRRGADVEGLGAVDDCRDRQCGAARHGWWPDAGARPSRRHEICRHLWAAVAENDTDRVDVDEWITRALRTRRPRGGDAPAHGRARSRSPDREYNLHVGLFVDLFGGRGLGTDQRPR